MATQTSADSILKIYQSKVIRAAGELNAAIQEAKRVEKKWISANAGALFKKELTALEKGYNDALRSR